MGVQCLVAGERSGGGIMARALQLPPSTAVRTAFSDVITHPTLCRQLTSTCPSALLPAVGSSACCSAHFGRAMLLHCTLSPAPPCVATHIASLDLVLPALARPPASLVSGPRFPIALPVISIHRPGEVQLARRARPAVSDRSRPMPSLWRPGVAGAWRPAATTLATTTHWGTWAAGAGRPATCRPQAQEVNFGS